MCDLLHFHIFLGDLETTACHVAGRFKQDFPNANRAHVGMGHTLCRRDDEEDSVVLAPYGDKANRVEPVRNNLRGGMYGGWQYMRRLLKRIFLEGIEDGGKITLAGVRQ